MPVLNGTYDSYLKLVAGRDNSIFFQFSIGDAFSGYSATVDFSLKGEFEVSSEYLNEIHKELKNWQDVPNKARHMDAPKRRFAPALLSANALKRCAKGDIG